MIYTTGTVSSLLRVSRETIRTWAENFAGHLSSFASPGDHRHRQFSDEDLKVLTFIAQMKRLGRTYEEIHAALDGGEWKDFDATELGSASGNRQITELQTQITDLENQLESVTRERDDARMQSAADRALRENAERQLESLNREIRELTREIGRLESKLE